VAIVIVSHLNKSSGATAMNRITGSGAFVAAARAAWVVAKDPTDHTGARRLFLPAKNNLGRDSSGLAYRLEDQGGAAVVRWEEGSVSTSADTAHAEPHGQPGPEPEKREAAEDWLRHRLTAGPDKAKDITEEAKHAENISKATLDRAKEKLGVKAFRPVNPGEWFWKLPSTTS
jgi:putative DNA primase/helicase